MVRKPLNLQDLLKKKKTLRDNLNDIKPSISSSDQNDFAHNFDSIVKFNSNIPSNLDENIKFIKETLGNSSDIVLRKFEIGREENFHLAVVYTDGLADKNFVQDFVLETLMVDIRNTNLDQEKPDPLTIFDLIKRRSLTCGEVHEISDTKLLFFHILSGDTVLLMNNFPKAIVIGSRGWTDRGVQEPSSQTVVRGPKDGFSETLRTNTALIRRKIRDPRLWIETSQIGEITQTDVSIIYLKGIANEKIIKEVRKRLKSINTDSILESGYIEEFIQDEVYTPFPTIYNTERPDAVAAGILEGRIAILVDGTPFVLLAPAIFVHFFQSSEDYYQRSDIGTAIRLLRYIAFFLALITPSAYVAVSTYHQEMLPTPLLISLAEQRAGVPFPAVIEALIMEITFEILREAGVRMPRAVGSAISIVGALVIGQAAVEAGIVSSTMVIVVSLTAISSFVSPTFNMAIAVRLLRFPLMFLAASFGLVGIMIGLLFMVLHLNSLRSFGVPYLTPYAPFILQDQKDNLLRFPRWKLNSRPRLINKNNLKFKSPTPQPPKD